jgi:hypothetical protein
VITTKLGFATFASCTNSVTGTKGWFLTDHEILVSHHEQPTLQPARRIKKHLPPPNSLHLVDYEMSLLQGTPALHQQFSIRAFTNSLVIVGGVAHQQFQNAKYP